MRIALLTGPCPPGECGVGDYVVLLAQSLNAIGVNAEIISVSHWNVLKAFGTHYALKSKDFDVVQIHYPSLGVGTKLGPQANALLRRCVITLHEASQVHILRQLALYPFSIFPRHVIFFSEFERKFGIKWAPWISCASSVIPPPSNIRRVSFDGRRDLTEIVSFGLIRPGRGHDQILELGSLISASGIPLRIRVIGTPQSSQFVPYFDSLRQKSANRPIIWDSGLSEEEVAKKLAGASIAYLPYPDGAAELRSTLKAALLNGLAVVTTQGRQTPSDLGGVVRFSESPEDALAAIRFLLENREAREALSRKAAAYVKDWTWERTAELHTELYQRILSPEAARKVTEVENA